MTALSMRSARRLERVVPALSLVASLGVVACEQQSEEVIEAEWRTSAHANVESEAFKAFTRWSDENSAQIPAGCAKCHSTVGYLNFLGADGSEPGTVNQAVPAGSTVECEACHNDISERRSSAVMPSGLELFDLGANSDCLECHQGRNSTLSVDEIVSGLPDDRVNRDLRFISIHNNAAGPTQYGTQAKGGYQYDGEVYLGRYEHALEINSCTACHDAHTLAIDARRCSACHLGVDSTEDLAAIRLTNIDFDGDGDTSDGLASEIETLSEDLLLAIQAYAARGKGLEPIVHEAYPPFFFNDADQPYNTWTPRLLRAAYNYQFAHEGAGGYAHNPKYVIQLLYDSLTDLGAKTRALTRPGPG